MKNIMLVKSLLTISAVFLLLLVISILTPKELVNERYVSNGEILYEHHCTNCHSRNLKNPAVGPALGNITKHRSLQYLRNVTRNFNKEIRENNELATCVYRQWGSLMSEFEYLSESEIDSIYRFIEEESILQNIGKSDVVYIKSCEEIEYKYRFFDENGDVIFKIPSPDSVKIQKQIDKNNFEKLYFRNSLYNYNDLLPSSSIQLSNFKIESQLPNNVLIKAFLVFEDIGFTTSLNYFRKSFYYAYPNQRDSYELYKNQKFSIILLEESTHDRIYFGYKELYRSELNKLHKIELKEEEKTKIKKLLEK